MGLATTVVALEDVAALEEVAPLASEPPAQESAAEASAPPSADEPSPQQPVASIGPDVPAVTVRMVDRRSAYTLVDPAGEVVQAVPAAAERRWQLTLVRVPDAHAAVDDPGWRVHRVEPVP